MQYIGEFIIENVSANLKQTHHHSVVQNGIEIGMSLYEMCEVLFDTLDMSKVEEFKYFEENIGKNRKTIFIFKYDERKCEIGEFFETQESYFWVRISAVEA